MKRLSRGSGVRGTLKQVANDAREFLGSWPGDMNREYRHQDLKIVWTGLVLENCFRHEFELPAVAKIAKTSHSTVHFWKEQWYTMDWRTRHGWLILFDGYREFGTPVREGINDIKEFVSENFAGSA